LLNLDPFGVLTKNVSYHKITYLTKRVSKLTQTFIDEIDSRGQYHLFFMAIRLVLN